MKSNNNTIMVVWVIFFFFLMPRRRTCIGMRPNNKINPLCRRRHNAGDGVKRFSTECEIILRGYTHVNNTQSTYIHTRTYRRFIGFKCDNITRLLFDSDLQLHMPRQTTARLNETTERSLSWVNLRLCTLNFIPRCLWHYEEHRVQSYFTSRYNENLQLNGVPIDYINDFEQTF